ncbi:MAG TPA: hypothetical protein VFW46_22375 [Stellaceae bacterium]|nr:hypothetical protein [Stellaceae bacterium]
MPSGGLRPRWKTPDGRIPEIADREALGEFPLEEKQVRGIASLMGFEADPVRFHYHIEAFAAASVPAEA